MGITLVLFSRFLFVCFVCVCVFFLFFSFSFLCVCGGGGVVFSPRPVSGISFKKCSISQD